MRKTKLTTLPLAAFFGLALSVCLAPSAAKAQSIPRPDTDPVDVTVNEPAGLRGPNAPQALIVQDPGYTSIMLDAEFNAQFMKLTTARGTSLFWGARLMRMSPSSPLQKLGLQTNDVITRLDTIPIATGMTRTPPNKMWDIHQMEKHFGPTKIRFIKHKSKLVQEVAIDLGPHRTSALPPALEP